MKPWKSRPFRSYSAAFSCFNGATAMKPWKSNLRRSWIWGFTSLQWGHGDEAVEEFLTAPVKVSRQ